LETGQDLPQWCQPQGWNHCGDRLETELSSKGEGSGGKGGGREGGAGSEEEGTGVVQTLSGEDASLFALVALFIVRRGGRSERMCMGRVHASSLYSALLHLLVPPSSALLSNAFLKYSDATPLYTLRVDNDTAHFKAQVDRLQHLLHDAPTEQTPPLRSNSGSDYLASRSRPHLVHVTPVPPARRGSKTASKARRKKRRRRSTFMLSGCVKR
jgi:hypothetical protein